MIQRLADHVQCDPATLNENQVREYFLFRPILIPYAGPAGRFHLHGGNPRLLPVPTKQPFHPGVGPLRTALPLLYSRILTPSPVPSAPPHPCLLIPTHAKIQKANRPPPGSFNLA